MILVLLIVACFVVVGLMGAKTLSRNLLVAMFATGLPMVMWLTGKV